MLACTETVFFRTPRRFVFCTLITLVGVNSAAAQCANETELHVDDDRSKFISMGISGDRVIGGVVAGLEGNAAYVFAFDGTNWIQEAKLLPDEPETSFGGRVAISGDVALVSDEGNAHAGPFSGAVYVYRRVNGVWAQEAKLTANDAEEEDRFGFSIAIDGDRAVIAALHDDDLYEDSGAVYVFRWIGTRWIQEAKITRHVTPGWLCGCFGASVAIDGDTIMVSPEGYIFRRSGSEWIEEAHLNERGGVSLDAAAGVAVIANHDGPGWLGSRIGIYRYGGGSWALEHVISKPESNDGSEFGNYASVSGDRLLVGGSSDSLGGFATLYTRDEDGSSWTEVRNIHPTHGGMRGAILQGQRAVVIAPEHDHPEWQFPGAMFVMEGDALVGADCNENASHDACEIESGYKFDCNENGVPDDCDGDCNGNGLADVCDLDSGFSNDCDANGVPDDCEDCNGNGLADVCDIDTGFSNDCNGNGFPDECDIVGSGGALRSRDCNSNGIPDECDGDCNGNRLADECDLASGFSNDCNSNGIPDECDGDCNGNRLADECDIDTGFSDDCNADGVPDECEEDCNDNGVADACDIADGTSLDCNGDGVIDDCSCEDPECSLGRGGNTETGADGPQGGCCEPSSAALAVSLSGGGSLAITANRFLVFEAGDPDLQQALSVTFVDLPRPFDGWNGATMWVGPPSQVGENSSTVNPVSGSTSFQAATLSCSPYYRDWSVLGELHVFHEGIVPEGSYRIEVVVQGCDLRRTQNFSDPLTMLNPRHGDIVTDLGSRPPSLPNESVDIVDALAVLGKFANVEGSIRKARADLEPGCLDLKINVSDVLAALQGFSGVPYPFLPTAASPCDSACMSPLP